MEYEELSAGAKALAREKYGRAPVDWDEYVYDRFKEEGRDKGFSIDEIQFSGFYSQGDGASWTGRVNLMMFIEHFIKPEHPEFSKYAVLLELMRNGWVDEVMCISRRSFHYNHSGTMSSDSIRSVADLGQNNGATLEKGILAGATVFELDQAIDSENLILRLEELVLDEAKDYADEIYKALREEYEGYTSEEAFKELIYINGWRFNEKGGIEHGV